MPGTLYNENNVAVGMAAVYMKPWTYGMALTQIADSTVPLSNAGVVAWEAAGWTVLGATNEGFKVNAEASTTTITIEEQSTPVGEQMEAKTLSIEAALAEDTLESISLAWGGGTITTVAGPPAKRTMPLLDGIKYVHIAMETKNPAGFARRYYIPKMSMFGSGETSFRRAAEKRLYPIKMNSLCKPSDIIIVDFTS
jgi:hypothetical protein